MRASVFDHADEARLLRQYIETLNTPRSVNDQHRLQRACLTFCELHPGETCLGLTYSTEWFASWAAKVPPAARVSQVMSLSRWWSWLFERGALDDNVLACFYPSTAVLQETTPVVLSHNLQRLIARHLEPPAAPSAGV